MTNVYVRKKPLLEQDTEIVKCINENNISVNKKIKTYDGKFKNKIVKYNFNGVFDDTKSNSNIFTQLIEYYKNLLNDDNIKKLYHYENKLLNKFDLNNNHDNIDNNIDI